MKISPRVQGLFYRALTWLAAFLAVCTAHNFGSFTVYQHALKVQYFLQQYQVSLTIAFTEIGMCTMMFTGYLCYQWGERRTCALGLVINTGAYALLWMSTYYKTFHSVHFYLLYLYYLAAGVGAGVSTAAALSATNRQFQGQYFATIIGTITSATNVGPLIFTAAYNTQFLGDYLYQTQDLRGYFLFVMLAILVTHTFGCLAYGLPLSEEEDTEQSQLVDENTTTSKRYTSGENLHLDSKDAALPTNKGELNRDSLSVKAVMDIDARFNLSPLDMCKTARFQLILWPTAIVISLKYIPINNINIMLLSFGLTKYATTLPYLSPTTSIIGKTIVGVVVDATEGMFPRAWYLVIASVLNIVFGLVALWTADNIVFLSIAVVVWSLASGICNTVQPAINKDDFGKKNFAVNTGCTMGLFSILVFVAQLLLGITYDMEADPDTGVCYGLACYRGIFIYSTLVSSIATVVLFMYLFIYKKNRC